MAVARPVPDSDRGSDNLYGSLRASFMDVGAFAGRVVGRPMRDYQLEPARAIAGAVVGGEGGSFSVMMSRQAGKNELSAHIECYLLALFQNRGGSLVKVAPTQRPQVVNSIQRLSTMLGNPLLKDRWKPELGYMIRLGLARAIFLSARPVASVVGATASLLMEFDEAQDIDPFKHDRDFVPMTASTNAPRVYYGTAWDDSTLLERVKQQHLESEKRDGNKRHFEYPWWVVAEAVPAYGAFVEAEKARLGEAHPIFKTQYELKTISGAGRFLTDAQIDMLRGSHSAMDGPQSGSRTGAQYVAGIDIAGEDEESEGAALRRLRPRKDSTVVTIGRVELVEIAGALEPRIEIVRHYWWTGEKHRTQYERLLELLRNRWRVSKACVDGTGIGAGLASFLRESMGASVVEDFQFTAKSKSELAYELLSAVNAGRLSMYTKPASSVCWDEFWIESVACRYEVDHNQRMRFCVPDDEGHDDFVMSLALTARAAADLKPASELAVVHAKEELGGRF